MVGVDVEVRGGRRLLPVKFRRGEAGEDGGLANGVREGRGEASVVRKKGRGARFIYRVEGASRRGQADGGHGVTGRGMVGEVVRRVLRIVANVVVVSARRMRVWSSRERAEVCGHVAVVVVVSGGGGSRSGARSCQIGRAHL